jgi:hypothetical protein
MVEIYIKIIENVATCNYKSKEKGIVFIKKIDILDNYAGTYIRNTTNKHT